MALETVVYPQETFGYGCKEFLYNLGGAAIGGGGSGGGWEYDRWGSEEEKKDLVGLSNDDEVVVDGAGCCLHGNWGSSSSPAMKSFRDWDNNSNSSPDADQPLVLEAEASQPAAGSNSPVRRKRRRTRTCKNKEELENQRMTHITVERNRRKQMNDYLAVIRSLMPPSYVQRGDQASIIGGAINFVKELEQHLQTLEAQKRSSQEPIRSPTPLLADFFTSPQYSTRPPTLSSVVSSSSQATAAADVRAENRPPSMADIEVTMAESHANLKILTPRRPRQLLKVVAGLQSLWFTVLHLNVTTVKDMVLYSLSVKLEDGCQLTTADEIADAVNLLLGRIQEEASLSCNPS